MLNKTILMIREMKVHLEYLNMPVYDIISCISDKSSIGRIDFIDRCRDLISEGYDFPVAWECSVNSVSHYKREEKRELLQLGANFGTSNVENQIEMLTMHKCNFEFFLDKAKMKEKKYGKMSVTICALIGCMFFITVI